MIRNYFIRRKSADKQSVPQGNSTDSIIGTSEVELPTIIEPIQTTSNESGGGGSTVVPALPPAQPQQSSSRNTFKVDEPVAPSRPKNDALETCKNDCYAKYKDKELFDCLKKCNATKPTNTATKSYAPDVGTSVRTAEGKEFLQKLKQSSVASSPSPAKRSPNVPPATANKQSGGFRL